MADAELRDQIARIEADIEQLAEGLDQCRKAMLLSKVAIVVGGVLLLAYFLGAISFDPTILIGAIAAIVGGVVVFGSNSSTAKQTMCDEDAESQQSQLIDMIDFGTTI
jgi:hypothetical protein